MVIDLKISIDIRWLLMSSAIFISDDLVLLSYSDDPEFDANSKPCCRAVMKAKCCNTPITWAGIMKYEEFLRNTLFCFAGFKSLVNRTSSPVCQWHCWDRLGCCWIEYCWVHRQPESVSPQDLVYHTPHCIEVLDKNYNRLEQGGRSCAKVRRAFAEKFGFGRKF